MILDISNISILLVRDNSLGTTLNADLYFATCNHHSQINLDAVTNFVDFSMLATMAYINKVNIGVIKQNRQNANQTKKTGGQGADKHTIRWEGAIE